MAIKAADLQKKLPDGGKKNCKECGFPTCFAFAMKLVAKGTTVDKCKHLSEEVKAWIVEELAPPIRLITIGGKGNEVVIGEEDVIYRHEKTFIHPPGIGLLISDKENTHKINEKISKLKEFQFERVGLTLKANEIAVKYESGDKENFLAIVKKISESNIPLIIISDDLEVLFSARDLVADQKPLIYPITKSNIDAAIPKIKEKLTPVGVKGNGIEELIPLTIKLKEAGIEDIVIDSNPMCLKDLIRDYTLLRKAALKKNFRPLGYPILSFACSIGKNLMEEALIAATGIIKYAGLIILSDFEKEILYPILVARMNIYTDPRFPLAVEEKIYEIGKANEGSPALITTNFALTYFAVASEIENSKVPSYLCIQGTDGLCVLAGWSSGKFTGETVGAFIKKCGIADKIKNKKLIIPGLAARIKGEIEEELPGWEIIVGPREASDIPKFLPPLVEKWK